MIYDTYEQNGEDQRGSRGGYSQQVTDRTRPLDALAKVFSETPYTAIIQKDGTSDLYISLPDQGVGDVRIDSLKQYLIALLDSSQEKRHDQKKQLFLEACCGGNKLFVRILNDEEHYQRSRFRRRDIDHNTLEGHLDYIEDLREGRQRLFTDKSISSRRRDFIDELVQERFDEFLSASDIELLEKLDLKDKILHIVEGQYDRGVHVEAKGVHYAHRIAGGNNFYIGLAKSDNREGGCCGSCTVEFSLLEQGQNTQNAVINVYRTADYPESFPPNTYNPSPSVRQEDRNGLINRKDVVQGAIGAQARAGMRLNEQHNQSRAEIINTRNILGDAIGIEQEELSGRNIEAVAQDVVNALTQAQANSIANAGAEQIADLNPERLEALIALCQARQVQIQEDSQQVEGLAEKNSQKEDRKRKRKEEKQEIVDAQHDMSTHSQNTQSPRQASAVTTTSSLFSELQQKLGKEEIGKLESIKQQTNKSIGKTSQVVHSTPNQKPTIKPKGRE